MKFQDLDIDGLQSVDERLKPTVKELFRRIIEQKEFYNPHILDKIADDLITGKFEIMIPNDITEDYTTKDGLSGIDENEYIKNGNIQGRIIIFPSQLKKEQNEMLKTLSHEFEHYVCQSNENIACNLEYLKSKDFDMSSIMKDSQTDELPKIGGFCGNIIELKNGFDFYEEGSTEIISSNLVGLNPVAYRNRISFLNGVLNSFGKNVNEMKIARRNGNLSFLEEMIPEPYFQDIPKLEKELRSSLKHKENVQDKKDRLDKKLFEYIDFLYESSNLRNLSKEEQGLVIGDILETSIMGSNYKKAEYKRNDFTRELSKMVNHTSNILDNNITENGIQPPQHAEKEI